MKKKCILCINIFLILFVLIANVSSCLAVEEDNSNTTSEKKEIKEEQLVQNGEVIKQDNTDLKRESVRIFEKPRIELETEKVSTGEDFEVSVYVNSESGLSTAEFTIKYDERT